MEHEQKATACGLEAADILKGISPLAAHYRDEDFWKRSMAESNEDGLQ